MINYDQLGVVDEISWRYNMTPVKRMVAGMVSTLCGEAYLDKC